MGLLDMFSGLTTGDSLGDLGMIGGLLSQRVGEGGASKVILPAIALKMQQQNQERQNRATELQQLAASYKILKDEDQQARNAALFSGQPPPPPNPLLVLHEQKLAQLMGAPQMFNGSGAQPPVNTSRGPTMPQAPQGMPQMPQGAPQMPQGQMPQPQAQASPQGPQSAPTDIRRMLDGAGIPPAIAAQWASTPTGQNELFKKLADVYGPRVVNNVLMQLKPNGQTTFLGGAVGNDTLPVVSGPNGLQVQPIQGLQEARAGQAAATTGATKAAEAPYQMVTVPQPDGSTRLVPLSSLVGKQPQAPAPQTPQAAPGVASLSVTAPPRPGSGASFGTSQTPADRAQAEDLAKFHAQTFIDTQQAGKAAQKGLVNLDRIDQLMQGVDTGKLTPAGMQIAAYGQALGLPIDPKLPNKQAAEALTGQIALELRNPSGGAGMPGALSDNDLKFLRSMTPGMAQTTEGRKMIIETKRKVLQRDQEVAQLARDYRAKNSGKVDDGFLQSLQDFSASHPLFPQAQTPAAGGWSIQEVK